MTYTVSGGMLNPTHSLTHSYQNLLTVWQSYEQKQRGSLLETLHRLPHGEIVICIEVTVFSSFAQNVGFGNGFL